MNDLQLIAAISVGIGILSCIIILADIVSGNKQHMTVMNFVWPVTGLYAGLLALIAYYSISRKATHKRMMEMNQKHIQPQKPFWQSAGVGTLHCGSGCTLGDIAAEVLLLNVAVIIVGNKLINTWLIDSYLLLYSV